MATASQREEKLDADIRSAGGRFPYLLPYESLRDVHCRLQWQKAQRDIAVKLQAEVDTVFANLVLPLPYVIPLTVEEVQKELLELIVDEEESRKTLPWIRVAGSAGGRNA